MLLIAIELSVEFWERAINVLGTLILTLVGLYVIPWLRRRNTSQIWTSAIERLDDAVATAVRATEQQVVSSMRKQSADGKLSPQEAALASAHALSLVVQQLGEAGRKKLMAELGHTEATFDPMLRSRIEAELHDAKLPSSTVVTVSSGTN